MEMNRMKKIVYSTLFFAGMFLTTACSDYLEVGSPSIVDSDFVFSNPTTARAALDGAYEQWRDCAQNKVFGDGLFYAADIAGSDIERHPESFSNQHQVTICINIIIFESFRNKLQTVLTSGIVFISHQ